MLERVCAKAFFETSIASLSILDSVVELGAECFYDCKSMWRVTFGSSSNLERIGGYASLGAPIDSLDFVLTPSRTELFRPENDHNRPFCKHGYFLSKERKYSVVVWMSWKSL